MKPRVRAALIPALLAIPVLAINPVPSSIAQQGRAPEQHVDCRAVFRALKQQGMNSLGCSVSSSCDPNLLKFELYYCSGQPNPPPVNFTQFWRVGVPNCREALKTIDPMHGEVGVPEYIRHDCMAIDIIYSPAELAAQAQPAATPQQPQQDWQEQFQLGMQLGSMLGGSIGAKIFAPSVPVQAVTSKPQAIARQPQPSVAQPMQPAGFAHPSSPALTATGQTPRAVVPPTTQPASTRPLGTVQQTGTRYTGQPSVQQPAGTSAPQPPSARSTIPGTQGITRLNTGAYGCSGLHQAMVSSTAYYQQNPGTYRNDLEIYNRLCR